MIDLEKLISKEQAQDVSYVNSIRRDYNRFIRTSDLPTSYMNHCIDVDNLPERIKTLSDNMYNIVQNRFNFGFNVANYFDTGNISSMLLDTYFVQVLQSGARVEDVVYIDTNLLLEDYKKLMDMGSDYSMSLAHSAETVSINVENAAYVIWDKFSLVNSMYDRQKLYNVLLIRKRRGLGNMFFIKDATTALGSICDEEMYQIMDLTQLVSLEQQKVKYLQQTNKKVGMKW